MVLAFILTTFALIGLVIDSLPLWPISIFIAISLTGYLFGSIPFGLILTKIFIKSDIRKIGSGNIGATNVLRTGNKTLALLTLLLDAGKGPAAILFLNFFSKVLYALPADDFVERLTDDFDFVFFNIDLTSIYCLIGYTTVIGHCFPIWLKFKGGKGVATTLGVLLIATPIAGFITVCTWCVVAGISRYSSLAALVAITIAPIAIFLIYDPVLPSPGAPSYSLLKPIPATITTFIVVLVFLRHKENIQRLIKGEESKIGAK